MSQFLLAYWWLIVIAIILVVLLTRSLIKLVITIIALAVIFALFWQVFINSGFSQSNQCVNNGTEASIVLNQKASLMNPGIERNQYICSESVNNFTLLVNCLNNSKQSNKLSFMMFSNLPWFRNSFNEIVGGHNQNCPNDQLIMPVFKD